MKVSLQTPSCEVRQLRAEIEQLTAEYERKNGPVQTSDIICRGATPANWNGLLVIDDMVARGVTNSAINQQVLRQYATAPCLTELAKSLGISVSSLGKRAGRLGVTRDKATKVKNNPVSVRAAKRLAKTAALLEAGESIEVVADRLDITPRQVRHYRQQLKAKDSAL